MLRLDAFDMQRIGQALDRLVSARVETIGCECEASIPDTSPRRCPRDTGEEIVRELERRGFRVVREGI